MSGRITRVCISLHGWYELGGNEHSIVSYESKGWEALRVICGMFFESKYRSDEQSDTEDGEEEEKEFVWDWDE